LSMQFASASGEYRSHQKEAAANVVTLDPPQFSDASRSRSLLQHPLQRLPPPPAASRARACAPTRCRSRSSVSVRQEIYRDRARISSSSLRASATLPEIAMGLAMTVPQPVFVEETVNTGTLSCVLNSDMSTVMTRPPLIEKSK